MHLKKLTSTSSRVGGERLSQSKSAFQTTATSQSRPISISGLPNVANCSASRSGCIGIVLVHPTASRRLHSSASAAASSCCRCCGAFRPCPCWNCRKLTISLTSSQMLNVLPLRNLNAVTLLPCRFVVASAIMLSGTQRHLARKACMLHRNTQSSSATRRR